MLTLVQEAAKAAQLTIEARIEEGMILCENVTISPAEVTKKSIGKAVIVPGWEVSKTINRPAQHPDEQDDVQVYEMGEATYCEETIVCLFLSTIIAKRTQPYWNRLIDEAIEAEFKESERLEAEYQASRRPVS